MNNKVKAGLLYGLPTIIIFGLFMLGHKFINPEHDRLEQLEAPTEVIEQVTTSKKNDDLENSRSNDALFGVPEYRYFSFKKSMTGNIPNSTKLFSFDVAVSLLESSLKITELMTVLEELEPQITPMILEQTTGMTSDILLTEDGRTAWKLKMKQILNVTLEKWGYKGFIHTVEITSFIVS
jgi:flagellar basal body-associated protein FliL